MGAPDDNAACDPPLAQSYNELVPRDATQQITELDPTRESMISECELPVVDLRGLVSGRGRRERAACVKAISKAAAEWGFFQVLNHGISAELLGDMRREQVKLFKLPFEKKASSRLLNDSYRWGTPTATAPQQFSWTEAFHVPLAKISEEGSCYGKFSSLRDVMEKLAGAMSELASMLAGVLAESMGYSRPGFPESCDKSNCFLRLNHYPPCPLPAEVSGLVSHTDSDFLTILHQDQVGGLQLMKDSKWVAVKPNPDALIVNIGDLFQAWSNDVYKSVEHKVMANAMMDRYSIAFFLCPSYESSIGSCKDNSIYRDFTFGEYRKQVQEDVKIRGQKVGLPRYRI